MLKLLKSGLHNMPFYYQTSYHLVIQYLDRTAVREGEWEQGRKSGGNGGGTSKGGANEGSGGGIPEATSR